MNMRKAVSAFLAVICVLLSIGICPLSTSAEGADTVYAATETSVAQGSYGYLYVYLDDLSDLASLNVTVYYDADKITVTDAYNAVSCKIYDSAVKADCVQFSYIFDGTGSQTPTNLFYFSYRVNEDAVCGTTFFDILVTDAYSSSLEALPIVGSRRSLEITEAIVSKTCSVDANAAVSSAVQEEFEICYSLNTWEIASGAFHISYDPELLEVVLVTAGSILNGKITDVNTSLAGSVYVSFVGTEYGCDIDLLTVRFRTMKNVTKTSSVQMQVSEFYDLDRNLIVCEGFTTSVSLTFDDTYAEDSPAVRVRADYSAADRTVTATVTLEQDSTLGAGDFVLRFDPDVLTYRSFRKEFTPDFFLVNEKNVSEGTLKFSVISTRNITDAVTFLTVVFDAAEANADRSTKLEISGNGLTDSMTNPILLNFIDADVTIPRIESYTVGGTITSFGKETDPITVQLTPSTSTEAAYTATVVGNRAAYAFDSVRKGTYTLTVRKANHLLHEETLTVTENDANRNVSLVLGNNGVQFRINSAYLVLSQNLNVVYRTTIPNGFSNPRMVFTFNGSDTIVTGYTVDDKGRYCFTFTGVNPQKMGNNICATLYAMVDETEVCVCVEQYSVRQYCVNQLNQTTDDALIRLVSDLLVYGEKAQKYQNYRTNALVTSGLPLESSSFVPMDDSYNKQQLIGTADEAVRYSSASLLLSGEISVLLGITTSDPSPYTFEVTINGRTDTYTSNDLEYRNGKYYLTFRGIKPSAFDDEIIAIIKQNDVQISQTLKYSVHTYIQKNQNTDAETLCELLRAIYNYGKSASAFASARSESTEAAG